MTQAQHKLSRLRASSNMSNQFGFVRFGVADLTHIGIVRFGEADYKQLLSNFILIATLATILYVALFVNDDNSEESKIPKPKGLISPVKKQGKLVFYHISILYEINVLRHSPRCCKRIKRWGQWRLRRGVSPNNSKEDHPKKEASWTWTCDLTWRTTTIDSIEDQDSCQAIRLFSGCVLLKTGVHITLSLYISELCAIISSFATMLHWSGEKGAVVIVRLKMLLSITTPNG